MSRVDRNKSLIRYMKSIAIIENQKDLAQKMGYNETYFSQIINTATPEPKDFTNKLLILLPNLNIVWLQTGEGEMILKEDGEEIKNEDTIKKNNHKTADVNEYMQVILQQSAQLSKSQEQIDRLITLLEKMNQNKQNS